MSAFGGNADIARTDWNVRQCTQSGHCNYADECHLGGKIGGKNKRQEIEISARILLLPQTVSS